MSAIRNTPLTPYPPIQNGKEREGGLLLPADFARLPVYGPSGELLLHPNGVAGIDYLWRDSTGRAHLHSGSELYLEATSALYLGANAFYDSASALWNRVNIAKAAHLLVVRDDPVPQLEFYTVAAGANPITWVGPANLTRAEVVRLASLATITGIGAHLTLAAGTLVTDATAGLSASTIALHDSSGDLPGGIWNAINVAGGAAPAFSTNWANLAGWGAVQYRKGNDKSIHLRGSCTKSIAVVGSETIFTLPTGFRPGVQESLTVASFNGTTPVLANISITTGGVVQLYGGHQGHLSFGGLMFYTD